jgi:hypothetical protein
MKSVLLLLLASVSICIAQAIQHPDTEYFGIVIDGKTRNIELTRVDPKDNLESDLKHTQYVGTHSSTGIYAGPGGAFSGPRGFVSKGHSNLPPNSSIAQCRLNAMGFVAREIQKEDKLFQNRKSAVATKLDEVRKDGTYVAIIERTTIGYSR